MRWKAWLNWFGLFTLLCAQVPALAQHRCEMPCCQPGFVRLAKPQPKCSSCPEINRKISAITAAEKSSCKCEIGPSSSSKPQPDSVIRSVTTESSDPIAFITASCRSVSLIRNLSGGDATLFSDSGPPKSRPHCAWIGRAPPVFLA